MNGSGIEERIFAACAHNRGQPKVAATWEHMECTSRADLTPLEPFIEALLRSKKKKGPDALCPYIIC